MVYRMKCGVRWTPDSIRTPPKTNQLSILLDSSICYITISSYMESYPELDFHRAGWLPYTKKNNPADIANYRPISLLNTDYKIFTKALTIKLARIAPDLIHPAQAGFVPGRHIYDQIWLTKRIIELAEATEQNGIIVALDQEKAYDKIEHDYLWRALKQFGIPDEFIDIVKSLYSDAH